MFTVLYILEVLLKIVALGLLLHPGSYLRDALNCMDFIVAMSGPLILAMDGVNIRSARLLRLARPLRTIRVLKSVRTFLYTIVSPTPLILDGLLVLFFIMFIFAVRGVGLWKNAYQQRCYLNTDAPKDMWVLASPPQYCSLSPSNALGQCREGVCAINRNIAEDAILNYDTVGNALLLVMKIVSLDEWPTDMFKGESTSNTTATALYFIFITIISSTITNNLMLAVLSIAISASRRKADGSHGLGLNQLCNSTIGPDNVTIGGSVNEAASLTVHVVPHMGAKVQTGLEMGSHHSPRKHITLGNVTISGEPLPVDPARCDQEGTQPEPALPVVVNTHWLTWPMSLTQGFGGAVSMVRDSVVGALGACHTYIAPSSAPAVRSDGFGPTTSIPVTIDDFARSMQLSMSAGTESSAMSTPATLRPSTAPLSAEALSGPSTEVTLDQLVASIAPEPVMTISAYALTLQTPGHNAVPRTPSSLDLSGSTTRSRSFTPAPGPPCPVPDAHANVQGSLDVTCSPQQRQRGLTGRPLPLPDAQVETEKPAEEPGRQAQRPKATVRSIITLALYLARKVLQKLVTSMLFNSFMTLTTVVNVVALAVVHFNQPE